MKHEEALALVVNSLMPVTDVTPDTAPAYVRGIADLILSAYRKGAGDMRERCAKWLDAKADTALGAEVARLHRDVEDIRALPLTDDAEEPQP